jgi:replicative DNA helicase
MLASRPFARLRGLRLKLCSMPETGRIPPQNLEAEQSVLGSLLIDKDAITKIADSLTSHEFYKDAHRMIYESMIELYAAKEPIDLLSLTSKLEEKKQLENIGGRTYLTSLTNVVPTASNIVYYAKIIRKKAILRKLISTAADIEHLGYDEDEQVDKLLDEAESKLFRISQGFLKPEFTPIKNLLTEAFDRIDELHKEKGKLRGIPTGFRDLDKKLAGLQKSDLIILAARPSVGKTSLALDIARQVAVKQKAGVGIFSLEMSKEQLIDRMICAQAGTSLWKLRTGNLSDRQIPGEESDFSRIGHAMGNLSEAPIFIDDTPLANVMEIRTKARRLHAEHNLGLIVLDYLQLMEGREGSNPDNRVQVVSEISRGLKAIARELNVPFMALSQLSRQVEQRPRSIPRLADLRESGSIEQDADVVMFIYREEMYKKETERPHIADILIQKHRNGPTGTVSLFFDENMVSFKNLEQRVEELEY